MPRFITLTDIADGKRVRFNVDNILYYMETEGNVRLGADPIKFTQIFCVVEDFYGVSESADHIDKLLGISEEPNPFHQEL